MRLPRWQMTVLRKSKRIAIASLGFTMIGPEAGEVIASVQMAMLAGLPYTALRDAISHAPDHG
jgi:pyruvate/2-oxoglutarate dehydrogenase complex dihydrolipoamide dehydrogenase (E3) component